MGVVFIVAMRPGADQGARMVEVLEHVVLEEFVAYAVVQGLHEPVMPRLARGYECLERVMLAAQRPTAAAMNSGPLSARSTWGAPWVRTARSRMSITSTAPMRRSTRKAKCWRVNSSMT